jgi:chromosome segregation ATPase
MLIHLCPGAWEIVHKPTVRELSIVASPAYKTTEFQPVGFYAAMNEDQWKAIVKRQDETSTIIQTLTNSQLSEDNKDVGSRLEGPQEPENKNLNAKEEVKLMSVKADDKASPHQAQGVVNVAPGETAPKQVEYEDLMNQLQQLEKQITQTKAEEGEAEALKKKVADLEAELAKRASKKTLSKKISELSKRLSEVEGEETEEAKKSEEAEADKSSEAEHAEEAEAEAKRASGKGIVAVDELQRDVLGNYDWFKDILKAQRKLLTESFKG